MFFFYFLAYNRIDDCVKAMKWLDENKNTFKGKCYPPNYFNLDETQKDKVMYLLITGDTSSDEKQMVNTTLSFQFEINTDHHIFARKMLDLGIEVNSEVIDP